MSDLMLYGVLRMPYDMAMSSELSRRQFYSRVQEAADRLQRAEAASPAAAAPEGALPPLPEPWQDRAQAELGERWRGYKPDSFMQAEINEWRARAAVEADRAQVENLPPSIDAALFAWGRAFKDGYPDEIAATRKALIAAIRADRAQQGEPVGWVYGNCYWERGNPRLTDHIKQFGQPRYAAPVPDTGIPTAGEVPSIEDADLTWAIAGKLGEFYPQQTPRDMEKNHRLARAIQRLPLLRQTVAAVIKAEVASRGRAQGGITKDNDNFRAPVSSTPTSGAVEPGPWQVLRMEDQPEPGLLLDVVLTNGVTEEGRAHSAIDWTQVADWRYSRAKAGEDA